MTRLAIATAYTANNSDMVGSIVRYDQDGIPYLGFADPTRLVVAETASGSVYVLSSRHFGEYGVGGPLAEKAFSLVLAIRQLGTIDPDLWSFQRIIYGSDDYINEGEDVEREKEDSLMSESYPTLGDILLSRVC